MSAVIVAGLVIGSVYGLIGVGLVLTYRTSNVFNFAHGALATIAAYLFYGISVDLHGPTWLGLLVSIPVLALALGVGLETLARRLARASLAVQIGATVGILLIVEALAEIIWGVNTLTFPNYLPQSTVQIFGAPVTGGQIITFAASLFLALGLNLFLRRSRWGTRMRAVVDNPDLVAISGVEPIAVRRAAWVIGSFLVTLSGLLFAPAVGLSASVLTSLVLFGFGAAAVGGFTRLNLAWLGGLAIGIAQAIITRYVSSTSFVGMISPNLPFIILFLVIMLYPKRGLQAASRIRSVSLRPSWSAPARVQVILGVIAVGALACVPAFAGYRIGAWSVTVASIVFFLALGLLVRMSGQISLCHMTFAAIGAVAFSKLTLVSHVPWPLALIVAGLICVPFGILLSVPAIRLSGLYLALATFGFGILVEDMFYTSNSMFGISDTGVTEPAPHVGWLNLGSQTGIYYVVLFCVVATALLVVAIGRSRMGRLLRGLSDSPEGLEALGASSLTIRMVVFGISTFLAGIAGALLGVVYGVANGSNFDPNTSLLYVVLLVIIVGREPWYALVAALGVGVIPTYLSFGGTVNYYLQIVFGVAALQVGYGRVQPGIPRLRNWLDRVGNPRVRADGLVPAMAGAAVVLPELEGGFNGSGFEHHSDGDLMVSFGRSKPPQPEPLSTAGSSKAAPAEGRGEKGSAGEAILEVRDLTVRFGGVVAVDRVAVKAAQGMITGIIGPNGAGKSTLLNACSGQVRPAAGHVFLRGRTITRQSPSWRARHGLGRTFQQLELFDSLTVQENVRLGWEAAVAGANPVRMLFGQQDPEAANLRIQEAIAACQLKDVEAVQVSELSTGHRRLVELARCLAGDFQMVLLDEPSAGLDSSQTRKFGEILQTAVADRGIGMLLVEHDMDLVMAICSYIYVMDFGQLIFEGRPSEVLTSNAVQEAYLGKAEDAEPDRAELLGAEMLVERLDESPGGLAGG